VAALPRRRTGRLPLFRAFLELLLGAARCAFAAAPFFGFQLWGWYRFCGGGPYGGVQGRPWCTRRPASIYAFVQEHYWCAFLSRCRVLPAALTRPRLLSRQIRDIGFLRYYRKEQLPNFALAAPMLAVTAAGVVAYWRADPHRVATLGLATQRLYSKPRELTALEQAVRVRR
jgi:phosphatidylinositol glycan class V